MKDLIVNVEDDMLYRIREIGESVVTKVKKILTNSMLITGKADCAGAFQ